jgi:hypothetical protein
VIWLRADGVNGAKNQIVCDLIAIFRLVLALKEKCFKTAKRAEPVAGSARFL